jgi:hypothetical protein
VIENIQKIKDAKATISRQPPDDMRFRPGHELAAKQAERELPGLYKALAEDVSSVAVPVYVHGEKAAVLAKEMGLQTPSAAVDLHALYGPLTEKVRQSIGRANEFGVNQFSLVIRELRQLAIENKLAELSVPKFREPETFSGPEELAKLVLRYAQEAVGDELVVNYIRTQTAEQVAKVVDEKVPVFPVFILNSAPSQRETLTKKLFKRNIDATVNAPSEVDEEAAIAALKTIKESLKPKNTNNTNTKKNSKE